MASAPIPVNDMERVAALRSYDILDTACETGFDDLARLAARLTGSPIAAVALIDSDRQWMKASFGIAVREMPRDVAFCSHAILKKKPLVIPDATRDRRFSDNPMVTGEAGIRFYAGAPLVNPDGFSLGALCIADTRPRKISVDHLDTLVSLARTVMTTLELHRAMGQIRTMAMTDALTGIANRPAFLHAMAKPRSPGNGPFSLLLLDLDGFKKVNDRYGHAAGDQVLREVAIALRQQSRRHDLAGRIGGDEFALLLGEADFGDAMRAAERLRVAIAHAMTLKGWGVTASVGAVCFQSAPVDGAAALEMADRLMYVAKTAGKNRVQGGYYTEGQGFSVAA